MSRKAVSLVAVTVASFAVFLPLARPQAAVANPLDKVCSLVGTIGEGWWGKACHTVAHPKQALGAAKALASGKPGQAVKTLVNGAKNNVLSPSGAVGITAIVAWAVGGAHFVLSETAKLIGQTTSPQLTASWFSSAYWRVAGVAALLTLPFLFAAAVQAVLRSDVGLIVRAALGYLPLAFLATGVVAPLAMMLLAITDWMGSSVASAAGDQGAHFLVLSGTAIGALGVATGSPFVTFLVALLTAAGGLVLWLELLIREAAVYVVVLMLPLVFAAMVWPARRVWAVRSLEVLVALILAKFAIVSVLALAAAALGHGGGSLIVRSLAGLVLVMLGAFAPWVLLRLLPLAEVASAVAGHVRHHAQAQITSDVVLGKHGVGAVGGGAAALIARMQGLASDAGEAVAGGSADRSAEHSASVIAGKVGRDLQPDGNVAVEPGSSPSGAPRPPAGSTPPVSTEESAPRFSAETGPASPGSPGDTRAAQQNVPPAGAPAGPATGPSEQVEPAALADDAPLSLPPPDPEDGPPPAPAPDSEPGDQ
jgi:hypothetical protein